MGSHGSYFIERQKKKNIQYPYSSYKGHFVLGIVYQQCRNIDIPECYELDKLKTIKSVINNLKFFFIEKWKIASDKQGSGNTANIGGLLVNEEDMLNGNGIFESEAEFDDFWINYKKITVLNDKGEAHKIKNLKEFRAYRKGNNKK